MLTIAFDTEQYYHKTQFSVRDLGYWHYMRDPRCEKYLLSVSDGKESWAGHPRDFNFEVLNGACLLSHNKAHDEECALAAAEAGEWPRFTPAEWHCTANMSAYLFNVRSLHDACKLGLGIDVDKGVRDRANGKHWEDMVKEGWSQDMVRYGRLDAQYPWMLWEKYGHEWPEMERRLSNITIEQGRYGVNVDADGLRAGVELMQRVIFTAEGQLPWIARGRPPGSPLGVAEECRAAGIPTPPVKQEDPEAAAEWEEQYHVRFPFVRALRNVRKARKMLASLETLQSRIRPDGTAHFSLLYCGTAPTMRWAGSGGLNFQNFNKEPLFITPENGFLYDRKAIVDAVGAFDAEASGVSACGTLRSGLRFLDFRGLITARPGKRIASVDLSQIEPRNVNYFAGNQDFIRLVAAGQSPYEAHARTRMGWSGGELKKEDKKKYAYAKERVLSLGYGCGWEKFRARAILNNIDIDAGDELAAKQLSVDGVIYTRWATGLPVNRWAYCGEAAVKFGVPKSAALLDPALGERCVFVQRMRAKKPVIVAWPVLGCNARREVEDFRTKEPGITGLWKNMDEDFKASAGGDFSVQLPNGVFMFYRDVRKGKRTEQDDDTGETYEKTVFTAQVGMRRKSYYGGMLVENLCQATARNVFAEGMLRLIDAGHRVLFSVHDEAVLEVFPGTDPRELERLMGQTPAWLPGCPIAAEATISSRFKK